MQENHYHRSRVVQHALGSGGHVQQDSSVPAQPADPAIQSYSTQESVEPNLYVWLLEPQ